MPFNIQPGATVVQPAMPAPQADPDVGLLDQLGSAFRLSNPTLNLYEWATRDAFAPGETVFDPTERMTDADVLNRPQLLAAGSPDEFNYINERLDREQKDFSRIEGGPLNSTLALMIASFVDPTTVLPVAGASGLLRGASALSTATKAGASVAAAEALGEVALQLNQPGRGATEGLVSIALGGATGFALMGGVAMWLNKSGATGKLAEQALEDQVAVVQSVPRVDASTGAAEAGFTRNLSPDESLPVAAKQLGPIARALTKAGLYSPGAGLAFSLSPIARNLAHRLVDTGVVIKGQVMGLRSAASLDVRIRSRSDAMVNDLFQTLTAGHAEAKAAGFAGDRYEFNRAVAAAMERGDAALDPTVEKAAKALRAKILGPLGKEAQDRGLVAKLLFGPDGVNPEDGLGYFPHSYVPAKVAAQPHVFKREVGDYLKGQVEKLNALVEDAAAKADDAAEQLAAAKAADLRLKNHLNLAKGGNKGKGAKVDPVGQQKLADAFDAASDAQKADRAALKAAKLQAKAAEEELEALEAADRELKRVYRADAPERVAVRQAREQVAAAEAALAKSTKLRQAAFSRSFRAGGSPRIADIEQAAYRAAMMADAADTVAKDAAKKASGLVKIDPEEVDEWVGDIIQQILSQPRGRSSHLKIGKRGPLQNRTLKLPADIAAKWIDDDAHTALSRYIRTVVSDVETHAEFGWLTPPKGDPLHNPFERIVQDAQLAAEKKIAAAGGDAKKIEAAKAELARAEVEAFDAQQLFERVRGVHDVPVEPSYQFLARAASIARTWNFARLMGSSVLSSLPDFANVAATEGFFRTFGTLTKEAVTGFKGLKLSVAQARRFGTVLETVMNHRMNVIDNLTDDFATGSKFERTVKGPVASTIGKLTLQPWWTDAMKALSAGLSTDRLLRDSLALAAGKPLSPTRQRMLATAGIDAEMARRIAAQQHNFDNVNGLMLPRVDKWGEIDKEAADTLRFGVVRTVNDSVISPGQGDTPRWMANTEWGKTLGQFKRFSIAAQTRVTTAMLQKAALGEYRHVMTRLTGLVTMGMLSTYLLDIVKDGKVDDKRTPRQWVAAGVDRSGIMGLAAEMDAFAGKAFGHNVATLATGAQLPRYRDRGVVGQALGPTAGLVDEVFATSGAWSDGKMDGKDLHLARRLMPLQNHFVLNYLLDEITGHQARQDAAKAKRAPN